MPLLATIQIQTDVLILLHSIYLLPIVLRFWIFNSPNGGTLTMAQAQVPLRAANKAAMNKERKYRAVAPANNLGFIALIFETTGRMHSDIDKLLHNSIKAAAINKGIPFEAL
jgi:hypothetical protein